MAGPLTFKHVIWDEANRGHILEEGNDHPDRELFEEDVEEVVKGRPNTTIEVDSYEVNGEVRLDLLGKTALDRVLFVAVAPKPNQAARPVSARDATESELQLYESRVAQRKGRR
jgi:uncharacterized DUF497 family protein